MERFFSIRTLILILVFLTINVSYGQPWYFNDLFNPNSTWASGMGVVADTGGYYGVAVSDVIANGPNNISFFKMNHNGEIVIWKNYGKSNRDYFPGWNGNFKKCKDSCFFIFGSSSNASENTGLLMIFDSTGDTVFTRTYSSSDSFSFIGRVGCVTYDKGFALAGDKYEEESEGDDILLIKTDSLGNELWRTQFGTDLPDVSTSIIETADSGLLIGAWTRIPYHVVGDPIVYKTDSLGNLEWSLNLGGPYKDDKAMVCNTHDSCIMVLTAYADSMLTPEFAYTRINLIKIELNGDTIWNKKYGPSKPINFISNIILKPSGGFLLCGHSMIEPTVPHAGWIMEVDSTGDSLWYRDYYYYPSGPDQSLNYLYDLSITSDNGIVGVGQAYTAYPPNNTQKMWVLKVDSIGCEFPNCWVGIEEDGETAGRKDGKIVVFPNPADDKITISVGNTGIGEIEEVSIYNNMGILLKKHRPDNQPEFSMDVSNLPAGIYFVRVRGSNNASCVRKLLIGR